MSSELSSYFFLTKGWGASREKFGERLLSLGGWVIFVDIRSSGLDRVVVKLFFLRGIGLPEAEQGKVNGAFME